MRRDEAEQNGLLLAGQHVQGDNNTVVGGDYLAPPKPEFVSRPSDIVKVMQRLDEMIDADPAGAQREYGSPSEIDEKLEYNAVDRYEEIIREFGQYGHAVLGAYRALEAHQPTIGPRVTRFIRTIYYQIAAQKKAQCSDDILEKVVERLAQLTGQTPDVPLEVILHSCNVLVAHAFINCDILKRVPLRVANEDS